MKLSIITTLYKSSSHIVEFYQRISKVASKITSDYELMKKSLNDHLVEKHRSKLIPYFDELKSKSLAAGSIGCSISGSGPSVFALAKGKDMAINIESIFKSVYSKSNIDFATYVSKISPNGVVTI